MSLRYHCENCDKTEYTYNVEYCGWSWLEVKDVAGGSQSKHFCCEKCLSDYYKETKK